MEDGLARQKYGHARFSLFTGHDTGKGEVIGKIGLPLDTFGYEVGLADGLQTELDLTVLGLYNSAEFGGRKRLFTFGPSKLAFQASVGTDFALESERDFVPVLASLHGSGSLLWSRRQREVTTFVQVGGFSARVFEEVDAFPDLQLGQAHGISASTGAELQITPNVVLGARLSATATFQTDGLLQVGTLGPLLVVPQIGLGLR